ncbi:hypothetical protein D3C84_483150 [compost metagenome]
MGMYLNVAVVADGLLRLKLIKRGDLIMEGKVFKFDHSEGAEIIGAANAKEALIYYFTQYQDDLQTEDILEFGGIEIKELKGGQLDKKHIIFDEEKNDRVKVSYAELMDEFYNGQPTILVTPNY